MSASWPASRAPWHSRAPSTDACGGIVEEFTAGFLARHPDGAVVRVSCTLKELEGVMAIVRRTRRGARRLRSLLRILRSMPRPQRAGWPEPSARGRKVVIEFAPEARKATLDLWPAPGGDLEIMRKVKNLFDPKNL